MTPVALDARTLQVGFVASLGPLHIRGTFRSLRGELLLPHAGVHAATLKVDVDAASIDSGFPMRDRHLRGRSFLDVAHHPRITYRSTTIALDEGELRVVGVLVLRGIARDVQTCCPLAPIADEAGQTVVSLCGPFDIPVRSHRIGIPRGLDVLNPLFLLVGARVPVQVRLTLHVSCIPRALLPALAR